MNSISELKNEDKIKVLDNLQHTDKSISTKRIAVLFPGVNYSTDCPLLYYAKNIYLEKGYTVIDADYNKMITKSPELSKDFMAQPIEERHSFAKNAVYAVKNFLSLFDWSEYEDIIFISKSLGTVAAGYSAQELNIAARHIYLTPLPQTLSYMNKNNCIAVAGTDDNFLSSAVLSEYCSQNSIPLIQFENCGHRLEVKGDINSSLKILESITRLYS